MKSLGLFMPSTSEHIFDTGEEIDHIMPKNPNPAPRQYKVGGKIRVNMHSGKIVDATIKAIIDTTGGVKYQIDFDVQRTALISEWQIVKDN